MNVCAINRTATTSLWMSPEQNTMKTVRDCLTGAAYSANLLFGLPIHGYVLWHILRDRREKIASAFILVNQLVSEILFCMSGICYFLDNYMSLCLINRIYVYSSAIVLFIRPLLQSYSCLEQYLATVHPVIFLRCKPLKHRVTSCCVSWLIVSAVSIVIRAFSSEREYFFGIAALYQFFLILMAFFCISILRALRLPGPGEGQKQKQSGNRMKRRAFKIILINLVFTTVTQLPVVLFTSLKGTIPDSQFFTFSSVNIWNFVITGFFHPLLYLYRVVRHSRK